MSEVGGGETLEQVLERLNNRSEYSAVRGTCMCILFVAAWAANLHVFRAARIDISCIYPPKFLDGLAAAGGSSSGSSGGGAGGGRGAHHLLSTSAGAGAGAGSSGGSSSSRSRSSSNASSGGSGAGSAGGAAGGVAGGGATAAGLAGGAGGLLLMGGGGSSALPLCHPRRVARLVSLLAAALVLCSLLMAPLLGQPYQHAPFPFYLLLVAALLYPLEATRPLRAFALLVGRVLWRVVFPRETEILFIEVLVGDILTSLSKVFFEMGLATAATLLALWPGAFDVAGGSLDVLPALFATTPFVLRIRQCSVQARHAPTKRQRLQACLNILKYCSSLPGLWLPLLLSHLRYPTRAIERVLLWALLANSLYSFAWDVVMDWGLGRCAAAPAPAGLGSGHHRGRRYHPQPPTRHPGLRPTLLFGAAWPYYGAIAVDFALRLLWALKYLEFTHRMSYDRFMLLIEALEVFRRGMWSVFRIEWECLSQRAAGKAAGHSRSDDEAALSLLGGGVGGPGGSGDSATDLELSLSSSREEEGLELLGVGGGGGGVGKR